ncbi:MAG: alpha,alpha-trehalase TreF [Chitinophagaceae bacterium]|nr:alpha,alpha-trehalase TreF [Chitinophagaceae bacterium]
MKRLLFMITLVIPVTFVVAQNSSVPTPDKIYGQLFTDVQNSKIFPDGKTFVDCVPKRNPKDIMYDYGLMRGPKMDLKKFVEDNFELPRIPQLNYITQEKDVVAHINNLWGVLRRDADKAIEGSSLLPLPHPYIVPGGRFREIYYWDSYFTLLGINASGNVEMVENMVSNFSYLINTYGHIPNGNRSYYLSRSQPPFFALMVELLAEKKGDSVLLNYLPALEKEYAFWMDGSDKLKPGKSVRRVVKLKDGSVLNRYWDDSSIPRQEAFKEDTETAEKSKRNKADVYRHLRAGAESGIDFSSRWLADKKTLATIQTTDFIAVDLNSLLYKLELVIARAKLIARDEIIGNEFNKKAEKRRAAIDKYCWNKNLRYYTDYNFKTSKQSSVITCAGMYPFCVFQGKPDYLSLLARQAAQQVKSKLLQPGGVTTTPNTTGQQWDAPNGWAPLQWMTIWGLDRCGQRELARDIAQRWMKLNRDVFLRTGKLMEKYNVVDTALEAGGGEYEGQDGFGWTNGVLLALIKKYGLPKE